jgi:molecular chaperone DnaK (HSP70)
MRHYIVGIDLGTTHTVVAYAPRKGARGGVPAVKLLEIEQLVAPGEVAALPLLPSVRYHPARGELAAGELQLPWAPASEEAETPVVIGRLARRLGAQVPGRMVTSAKSWLSHTAVDRLAPILPWGAPAEVPKVSPVQASASYLAHVRAAWDAKFPKHPLAQQDIVLTLPASFDEGARTLVLQAAREAGLTALRLLEEPQAAFYDWLFRHRNTLQKELATTQLILVVDVGGGTTDLSLIKVEMADGEPVLTRIGVGNHLMLGGDNMDLALAHLVESRLNSAAASPTAPRLSASALAQLLERCRAAKEQLLAQDAPEQVQVTLLGSGSRLIGSSRSVTLLRDEVEQLIVDGFFPQVQASDCAKQGRGGIVEFGLPFARDPAITRHIADFLRQHTSHMPDALLLNGGVFRANALAQRLQTTLESWRGETLQLLHNDNPDVAVARGAVAYALAQQGFAPKIGGGSARSYFLLLDSATGKKHQPRGICILPRGSEPGYEQLLAGRTFALRLGQPVRFHLYSTTTDSADHVPHALGDLLDLDPERFVRLPPIAMVLEAAPAQNTCGTALNARQELPVQLSAALTEVGTLEMHCVSLVDSGQRWLLEFDLRQQPGEAGVEADAPAPDDKAAGTHARAAQAIEKIERIFGAGAKGVTPKDVTQLRAGLDQILGEREQWPAPLLRQLFDALWQRAKGRRRSAEHERVWLNLAGFCLRPGFGDPLDGWRVQQLWSQYPLGVQHTKDKQVCAEWWTLWRRVAGGLAAPEQLRLLDAFAFNLHLQEHGVEKTDDEAGTSKPVKGSEDDMLRLGAALERIPVDYKVEIGHWLLERFQKIHAKQGQGDSKGAGNDNRHLWALGRLGARQPFYGNSHDVVPAEVASGWVQTLLALDWKRVEPAAFAATHLARVTGDRARDLPPDLRDTISTRLAAIRAPDIWSRMVREHVQLDENTQQRMFGESLPPGLKLLD